MATTLASKETDPKDKAAVKPDAVPTARADQTSARPARDLRPSTTQDRTKSDVSAGKSAATGNAGLAGNSGSVARSIAAGKTTSAGGNSSPAAKSTSVEKSTLVEKPAGVERSAVAGKSASADNSAPSVDATAGAGTVDNKISSRRPTIGKWARRTFTGLLFALCIGGAFVGWMHYGPAVKAMVARWVPNRAMASSPPASREAAEQASLPVLQADAADQAAVPAALSASGLGPSSAALPPETAQLLQSMSQRIDQLQASIEELKTGQEQISSNIARNSDTRPPQARTSEPIRIPEQNLGPRLPARPLRTAAAAAVRKPRPAYAPAQAGGRLEVEPVLRPPLPLHQ